MPVFSQPNLSAAVPLSVHILTFNSGATLSRALQSIGNPAEIIVMDGGSTDDTVRIAERFGARVIPQNDTGGGSITDFSAVRNRALLAATQPWVLTLDSDEVLSPALREEIISIVRNARTPAAFYVPRKYVTEEGSVIDQASTYPNERIYFFHRAAVTRWLKPVHERVELIPGIVTRRLQSPCLAPLPTPEEFKRKNERYIRIEVKASEHDGWIAWLHKRVLHTLRGRAVATARLLSMWIWPKPGKKLPLEHEWLRYWYAWRLMVETCPAKRKHATLGA